MCSSSLRTFYNTPVPKAIRTVEAWVNVVGVAVGDRVNVGEILDTWGRVSRMTFPASEPIQQWLFKPKELESFELSSL
jgi:hypothetical protein